MIKPSTKPHIDLYTPIKINLALHILGLNPQNYHLLDSLVIFSAMGDKIKLTSSSKLSFKINGPYAYQLANEENNLCVQAYNLMAEYAQKTQQNFFPVAINLRKNLPVASGIGGGSGDAGATIYGLIKLWQLQISRPELQAISLAIGADVPACLDYLMHKKYIYMQNIGEKITYIEAMPKFYILLVNNLSTMPTSAVFKHTTNKNNEPLTKKYRFSNLTDLLHLLQNSRNDLLVAASQLNETIIDVLDAIKLQKADFTTMSGSGASCIGLFKHYSNCKNAQLNLKKAHPDWFVKTLTIQAY